MAEYTTEKKILLWLHEHPSGGTSRQIAVDMELTTMIVDMTLLNLARQQITVKIPGKPPHWKLKT